MNFLPPDILLMLNDQLLYSKFFNLKYGTINYFQPLIISSTRDSGGLGPPPPFQNKKTPFAEQEDIHIRYH